MVIWKRWVRKQTNTTTTSSIQCFSHLVEVSCDTIPVTPGKATSSEEGGYGGVGLWWLPQSGFLSPSPPRTWGCRGHVSAEPSGAVSRHTPASEPLKPTVLWALAQAPSRTLPVDLDEYIRSHFQFFLLFKFFGHV